MDKIELYNSVLSDIGNLVLVIFGFSVTLFTVIYSFIIGKREQLKEYSDKIKAGNKDLLILQRQSNAIKFIDKFRSFNKHLIFTVFVDLTIYIGCIISKYLVRKIEFKEIITWIIGSISALIIIYVVIMLIITVKDYLKITKI
ncbi:MAG: hypothetical protein JXJ22_07305 [Bacteroidales bacterium]|nr:hypothetical protein [Bacteroidales bacterium]